MSTEQATDASK